MEALTNEQFATWKQHPVTKLLLQYCADSKRMVLYSHLERFEHDRELPNGGEVEARGAARILGEIATIDIRHIRDFYDVKDPAEPDPDNQ